METNLENYQQDKLTIDLVKANFYSILMLVPIFIFYVVPFYFLWHPDHSFPEMINSVKATGLTGTLSSILKIFVIMLLGIVAHELIHGITWARYAKNGFKSISFGVLWKFLAPYCHCNEPLLLKHYLAGAIMPAIVLGFLPAVFAILTNNLGLLIFGSFFTLAAIGDFMIIFLLRKEDMNSLVLDHPSEAGCFIYRKV